jgi:CRP/FNR family transcriptional regulator
MRIQLPNPRWTLNFHNLASLSQPIRTRLERDGEPVRILKGDILFGDNINPNRLFFLLQGTLKVTTKKNGKTVTLFRVNAGESCVMTTACVLSEDTQDATGIAETDIVAVALPKSTFETLLDDEPSFRQFVFKAYAHRVSSLLAKLHSTAFERLDHRLAQHLVDRAKNNVVQQTHAQLAQDLMSARPAISRLLKQFENNGFIEIQRGQIVLKNIEALLNQK